MTYFVLEPEVAGSLVNNTVLDHTVYPPVVSTLHYHFEGWLGDPIVESFPAFAVTDEVKTRLQEAAVSGVQFEPAEISKSDEFTELHPDRALPRFERLLPTGQAGRDDVGTAPDGRLVVSERALAILKVIGLHNALVDPYGG